MKQMIRRYVPLVDALASYHKQDFRGDLTAGLTTAVMLIPQGMGYAMLAGLPPIMGLYASLLPLAVYALFGSSRQLAVGPVAMVSLLVAAGVGAVAAPGSESYVAYAVVLALMVGVIQLFMGVARLGFLVNFLSHPVISGFTSAAALIIGFSQLKHLLGVDIPRSHYIHEVIGNALANLSHVEPITLTIGITSIAALMLLKRYRPRFPRALLVVAASSLVVWLFGLAERDVAIVGEVPAGLPGLALPSFDTEAVKALLPTALAISLVGFMESISVAVNFARRNRYEVSANQELVGLGLANLFGSLFRAFPVTGGFSRTAVNAQAGAKSGLASLITAGVVGLTLLFLTPLFFYLPKVVLASIIMTAVFGLIDVAEVVHLWKVKRADLAFLLVTFFGTLTLGVEQGILIGVGVSLLTLVVRTTRPHIAVLGQLPGTTEYRNVKRYAEARRVPGVLAVRMDAQFYFGNVNYLKSTLRRLEREAEEPVRAVVLDASGVNQIDSSAASALKEMLRDYHERGIDFFVAGVKGPVRDVLERAHLVEAIGADHLALSVSDAVNRAREAIGARPSEPPEGGSSKSARLKLASEGV